ncbi:MAG: hypothetical protein U5N86_06235 [Planctomycetota bacterium]|nr:hypothetical protein [Planctomycetota bacterium]
MNVVLFLGPLVGRYADKRSNPMKLAALSFASLAMFPLILYFCPGIMYAYGAHAWFSLGMVGVMMCWNLGPIFFAKNRDASAYIGIHVTLTGLRALLILPLVGFIKENTSTFLPVFILATTLFLCAATVMFFLNRNARTSSKFHTTASGRFETAGS